MTMLYKSVIEVPSELVKTKKNYTKDSLDGPVLHESTIDGIMTYQGDESIFVPVFKGPANEESKYVKDCVDFYFKDNPQAKHAFVQIFKVIHTEQDPYNPTFYGGILVTGIPFVLQI